VKTGGRLVEIPRYCWPLMAQGHSTQRSFGAMLWRIEALSVPAGQVAPAGRKTGESKEGDREVRGNSFEMSHFQVFWRPQQAGLKPSSVIGVARY